jgi:hypothetical protein
MVALPKPLRPDAPLEQLASQQLEQLGLHALHEALSQGEAGPRFYVNEPCVAETHSLGLECTADLASLLQGVHVDELATSLELLQGCLCWHVETLGRRVQ